MSAKLIVTMFVSLDGVQQSPGGPGEDDSGGFAHGGWLAPHVDEGFGRIMGGELERADGMLLGRKSYDILSAYWPTAPEEEGAAVLNSMRKYVASRSLDKAEWNNTEVLKGEAAQTVAELKKNTNGTIITQGSANLIQSLQHAELVDEYHLLVFPVVIGTGKRLFPEGTAAAGLKLISSEATEAGVVYSTYEWTGKPVYGSVV
jgi:dihydrofolate reductase